MNDTIATIETNRELTPGYRLLTLRFETDIGARAGQFAMLKAHAAFEPLLRRALAVYRAHGPRRLSFLYQVLGRGTQALAELGEGAKVDALLPLGNAWPVGDESSAPGAHRAIVVAGGIGSASVLMLCESLRAARVDAQVFFGAASGRVAVGCGLEDFRALDLPLTLTTDDGSLGEKGFVTAPLERHLRDGGGAGATIYACGPWVMMRRVAEIAAAYNVTCLVSLEAPMGCGFGVCVGCVVAMRSDAPLGYESYKRVCVDGSIFPAERIRWEVNAMAH
ncbi:MAG TPA: dihydroorotate dehydrogenase electron transfer subunit [Blastocatellia bacterium]|nr:dihydroorotate dehydrogenase electron transfer subunit [Blastocatellia bacterium]